MSDVFNRTTWEFLRSVNTPDYDPGIWIVNPDLRAVTSVPERYRKSDARGEIVEMSAGEKIVVDARYAAGRAGPDQF